MFLNEKEDKGLFNPPTEYQGAGNQFNQPLFLKGIMATEKEIIADLHAQIKRQADGSKIIADLMSRLELDNFVLERSLTLCKQKLNVFETKLPFDPFHPEA